MEKNITDAIASHAQALKALEINSPVVKTIADLAIATIKNGGKVIFMGNGGSAADAQHLAAELVCRFKKNRKALASIALTTDTSIITAIGNDFSYDDIFIRQLEALARPGDLVVGISTSGESKNIIKAIKRAKELNLKTIGFLGKTEATLVKLVDIALTIPNFDTARVQEMHILAGHIICELIEAECG